jgi:hypothetical protein
MEKFRGRLALKVARLTQTFFPESDGRNHRIQQMAHFVPNRCHTPLHEIDAFPFRFNQKTARTEK